MKNHTKEQFSKSNESHKSSKLYDPGNYFLLLYLNPGVDLKSISISVLPILYPSILINGNRAFLKKK